MNDSKINLSTATSLMRKRNAQALRDAISQRFAQPEPAVAKIDESLTKVIRLNVKRDVRTYERNPRQTPNEKYNEIKESIRTRGLDNPIVLTRRPGEKHYIPARGGNTRIQILHELIDEGEQQFVHLDFNEIPYPGEVALLAAHFVENEQRASLCFWDSAHSIFELKTEVEKELGKEFSQREYSEYLKQTQGIQASQTLLSRYRFAVRELSGLGSAGRAVSLSHVQDRIIPLRAELMRLAEKLNCPDVIQNAWNLAIGWTRTHFEQTKELDVTGLLDHFADQVAQSLKLTTVDLQCMQQVLAVDPDATEQSLRAALTASPCGQSGRGEPGLRLDLDAGASSDDDIHHVEDAQASDTPFIGRNAKNSTHSSLRQLSSAPMVLHDVTAAAMNAQTLSQADLDLQQDLWRTLEAFCEACELSGCLIEVDTLPLGFMVDIPADLTEAGPSMQDLAMAAQRRERYFGWWTLAALSEQNTAPGLTFVPSNTRYGHYSSSDQLWQLACEKLLGEESHEIYAHAFIMMTDPHESMGSAYIALLAAVRSFRKAYPARCGSQFWLRLGVSEKLIPYYPWEDTGENTT